MILYMCKYVYICVYVFRYYLCYWLYFVGIGWDLVRFGMFGCFYKDRVLVLVLIRKINLF